LGQAALLRTSRRCYHPSWHAGGRVQRQRLRFPRVRSRSVTGRSQSTSGRRLGVDCRPHASRRQVVHRIRPLRGCSACTRAPPASGGIDPDQKSPGWKAAPYPSIVRLELAAVRKRSPSASSQWMIGTPSPAVNAHPAQVTMSPAGRSLRQSVSTPGPVGRRPRR
jgi:hypothetical protein